MDEWLEVIYEVCKKLEYWLYQVYVYCVGGEWGG